MGSPDRGIDQLLPDYPDWLLTQGDRAFWEAIYDDGLVYSQAAGGIYGRIDRSRLAAMRIVHRGDAVPIHLPAGMDWDRFVLRRTTDVTVGPEGTGGRSVLLRYGWVGGPASVVSFDAGVHVTVSRGFRDDLSPAETHPLHPIDFARFDLHPFEGEPERWPD